jgi:hypothetical protein
MNWRVEYHEGPARKTLRYHTPEQAVTGACTMLDDGHDVFEIGSDEFAVTAGPAEIAKIYAMWIKTLPR